ncbi:putative conjugative transfer protein TraA [Orientia tsutsugamushi str. UT76]|uniref:Conjugal transfer protein TraA n=1 Tax=Orientia tsutsugamushi TaxID=784 RepID=A0A2U3RBY7_ORITS|nr:putative conjugative transfer protein TraA [Orientia tsutsugamushi str. UT76]SPR10678.1 conjugal transfer protein TraA [Orientia tsutsugamushi]
MVGDRIVFQKSNKDLQIQNSEFATLTSVDKNEFVAKTDAGKKVSFDSVKYNLNMAMQVLFIRLRELL